MTPLDITMNLGERPWTDCKQVKELGTLTRVGRLPAGMSSGKSSVTIMVTTPDGKQVLAQTSLVLFCAAADAMKIADRREGN